MGHCLYFLIQESTLMRFEFFNKNAASSPVYFIVRKNRKGHKIFLKYPAGFTVKTTQWNENKQRVREIDGLPYKNYNDKLDKIENTVKDIFKHTDYFQITTEFLRKKIDASIKRGKSTNGYKRQKIDTEFFEDAERFLESETKRTGKENAAPVGNTISVLRKFNSSLDWHHIHYRFYLDLLDWMYTKQWSKNYMGKLITNLRRLVKNGFKLGRIEEPYHLSFETMREKVDHIYLNEQELITLYNMSLPKAHERVCHHFLAGCWTGQRVGTYLSIDPNKDIDIQNNTITLMTNKGGGKVVLPIHWMLREIIEKYNGLPEPVSEQRLNRLIKEICEAAKFNKDVLTEKTIGGKKVKQYKPKWKMVSSHTARRSCATNLYRRRVPISTIMLILNHSNEKQTRDYIKESMHDEVPAEVVGLDFWEKPKELSKK